MPMMDPEQKIESCNRQIIEQLEKTERKLVLRIMENLIAKEHSMDSFLCGFHRTLEMENELNYYQQDRQSSPAEEAEIDACPV